MTRRLFDEDPYQQAFEAEVLAIRDEGPWLQLDQTAFYPEGGGQPADWGYLHDTRVMDVQMDEEGLIWHRTEAPLPVGSRVAGRIDWTRRFDHMQQHAGEHVLASCVHQLAQGFTHGLHIGREQSSIDISLPGGAVRLHPDQLDAIEALANERLQQDAPMRGWYPDEQELQRLTPRKPPGEHEHLRMVKAGDFELVACGGTHPSSTGQVGLVKIIGCEPARGKMRLTFVCGMRAIRYLQGLHRSASEAGALLSSPAEALPEAIRRLQEEAALLSEQLRHMKKRETLALSERLLKQAESLPGGIRLVCHELAEGDPAQLRELAAALITQEGVAALLALPQPDGALLLFARHSALKPDMAALLRASGAKGGGKPDFAQGKAPDKAALQRARALLMDSL